MFFSSYLNIQQHNKGTISRAGARSNFRSFRHELNWQWQAWVSLIGLRYLYKFVQVIYFF